MKLFVEIFLYWIMFCFMSIVIAYVLIIIRDNRKNENKHSNSKFTSEKLIHNLENDK